VIRSMTGFGEASISVDGVNYALEIRSLNNKYLKVTVRLPEDLQSLEAPLEAQVRHRVVRGTVTITCKVVDTSMSAAHEINTEALQRYLQQLTSVAEVTDGGLRTDIASLLSLPGVLQQPVDEQARIERAREVLGRLLDQACDKLMEMRLREGKMLLDDLMAHQKGILERLRIVSDRAPVVVDEYQRRLEERINSLLAERSVDFEAADIIREVAIFAEKSDIAEETARLGGHMEQFQELITRKGDKPMGRTLDFLAQEMLREANTIASKSNDATISREIVEIKGAIDRIKEQVQNVE
jgi:uncharacterized protein (TIGR00255 family)